MRFSFFITAFAAFVTTTVISMPLDFDLSNSTSLNPPFVLPRDSDSAARGGVEVDCMAKYKGVYETFHISKPLRNTLSARRLKITG